ncbi:MAG: HAD-IC family P-type ATPase [Actinomycetota bacterium]|nr:HAD-IC family P-type ATPase [Actinomycetota bacterium]
MTTVPPSRDELEEGLGEAEARRRLDERGRAQPPATSRSTATIVRANVFTVFNAILAVLGGLTLVFGDWRDALFLTILVANAAIGSAQELRAKRALDRLAALVAPHATVVRDGRARTAPVGEVVVGDLVRVEAGNQVVADGKLAQAAGLALDESILTGEARPVVRHRGEDVRSGSFVVEGAGAYVVTAVGEDSYAQRIAGEARQFRHPRSPLERGLNRLLFTLVAIMVPLGTMFVYALWRRDEPVGEAVTTGVAGIVTLVPEGLILLASLTFAAAGIQLARRGALAQQLNAIESLASVDVICLDKTGTLTDETLRVVALESADGIARDDLERALGRFAASSPSRNKTLAAVAAAIPAEAETATEHVPFSSSRRWSGVRLAGMGYVLGAPEHFRLGSLAPLAEREQHAGRRVVAFGATEAPLAPADGAPPEHLALLGLVVLGEELRAEARRTVEFFRAQGVELKVISGDAPETVAAIAADAGIDVGDGPVDASRTEPSLDAAVVGRIPPEGKRRLVERLRDEGRYVAMVGDGVNDVPALKTARLAIAQGTGSEMARSVADVVLVNGDFEAVPRMVEEGRKILRNVQRVTKLFVTKSAFAVFLILLIGITEAAYPLLPRHLTLAAGLTIGIPGFFLALAPSAGPWRMAHFLRDVARFSVPAGAAAGLGVLAAYHIALGVLALPLAEARTVATSVLVLVGLYFVLALEGSSRRRTERVAALCALLALVYALVLVLAAVRDFFELTVPSPAAIAATLVGAAVTIGGLVLTDERFVPRLSDGGSTPPSNDAPS